MIRNETYANGAVIAADVYDLATGTYTREEGGQVVSTRPLTADEVAALTPPPPPLPTEAKIVAALETIEAPMTTADVIDAILAALTPTEETPT